MYKTFPTFAVTNYRKFMMNIHSCLLCLGSNIDREKHLESARMALTQAFPNIRFAPEMETEAIGSRFLSPFSNQVATFTTTQDREQVRGILKLIERDNGRLPEDKAQGLVKLDIDLLKFGDEVLKPADLTLPYVQAGLKELGL